MYRVKASASFQREVRKLRKSYSHINQDLFGLLDRLEEGELSDPLVPGCGAQVFKARVPSSDQSRGKRGGFRVVYYLVVSDSAIHLLTVYAKSRRENIRPDEIRQLIQELGI